MWNQKNDDPYFLNSSVWGSSKITLTINNGVLHGVVSNDSSPAFYGHMYNDANHIYAYTIDYIATEGNCYIYAGGKGAHLGYNTGTRQVKGIVFSSGANSTIFAFYPNLEAPVGSEFDVYGIRLYDLTKMFGEGNEPTTIEEFYSRCPIGIDMNAYNEGEVIHMTAEGIKSIGDNAWDEEWEEGTIDNITGAVTSSNSHIRSKNYTKVISGETYYMLGNFTIIYYDENYNQVDWWSIGSSRELTIPNNVQYLKLYANGITYNNDIMITLVHSGWKQDTDAGYQPYWEDRLMFDKRIKDEFPNGMSKWDMVYNRNGKGYIVKGTGVVDMGELPWTQYGDGDSLRFSCDENYLPSIKKPSTIYESIVVCAKYSSGINEKLYLKDDVIMVTTFYNERVSVKDTSYADAASFKAAMAGVPLYYELAEPIIIEYDEPFNLDYRVADFGTEQAIGSTPSAPISADIIYQFNAVDMIREHEIEINELKNLIAEMQTKLNSLS